jgi:hypothetical protein
MPFGCLKDNNPPVGTDPKLTLIKTALNRHKNPAMFLRIRHDFVVWNLTVTERWNLTDPLCCDLAPILDLFSQLPLKTLIQQ